MKLAAYKVLHLVLVLFAISVVTFGLIRLLPGDPALVMAAQGGGVDPAQVEAIRSALGLDLPVYEQYFNWIAGVLQGDLGTSYRNNQPVTTRIGQYAPVTVHLIIQTQVFSLLVAVPLALYVAPRRNSTTDHVVGSTTFSLQAIPTYVVAIVGVAVFAIALGWLPAIGYVPLSEGFWASTRSLIIATIALSSTLISIYVRVLRESVIDTLRMDYILVGRALGFTRRQLLWRFALKPSLPPLITMVAMQTGILIGSAVVIEVICGLPGLGTLLLNSITSRDYMTIQGLVLVFAVVFVLVNFIADIIHMLIDSRVRVTS